MAREPKRDRGDREKKEERDSEFVDKLVHINRVAKVVKGGRRFGFAAVMVQLRSAPPGTCIIAGGPMRAVFDTLGMQDVVAKSLGSSNPYNMVRATFDALKHQDSPRSVAARRNIKVSALQSRRREGGEGEAETAEG